MNFSKKKTAFDSVMPIEAGDILNRLDTCWNFNSLSKVLSIKFSRRLKRSLGRCIPRRALIKLNPCLLKTPFNDLFPEVLCHEAAHFVVHEQFGHKVRPHGTEWQHLMKEAGYKPRTTIKANHIKLVQPKGGVHYSIIYDHRCLVCQSVWSAKKYNKHWRCSACLDAGLDGKLVVKSRKVPIKKR